MSIFRVDKIAGDVLSLKEKGFGRESIIKKLSKKYRVDTVNKAFHEIETISSKRFFKKIKFSEWSNIDEKIKYKTINSIDIYLAHICNMACSYCSNKGGSFNIPFEKKMMSWKTAKAALDWFFNQKREERYPLTVCFFGGEPLLNKNIFKKSIRYIHEKWRYKIDVPLRVILSTNGTLLDKDILGVISKYKCQINVSLDASKEEHDRERVFKNLTNTYDIISNNIKYSQKMFPDIPITISSTANQGTSFTNIFERNSVDSYSKTRYRFNMEHSIAGNKDNSRLFFCRLQRHLKRYYVNRLKNRKSFIFMDPESFGVFNSRSDKRIVCGAGISKAAVIANGDIYICAMSIFDKKFKIGSVFAGLSDRGLNKIREIYKKLHRARAKYCFKCWARMNCPGGCILPQKSGHQKSRFAEKEDKNFICDIQRLCLEYCIRSYETINAKDAENHFEGILNCGRPGRGRLGSDDNITPLYLYRDLVNAKFRHIRCLNPF